MARIATISEEQETDFRSVKAARLTETTVLYHTLQDDIVTSIPMKDGYTCIWVGILHHKSVRFHFHNQHKAKQPLPHVYGEGAEVFVCI